MREKTLRVIGAAFVIIGVTLGACMHRPDPTRARGDHVVSDSASARLFAQHCATCHGEDGSGRGPAASLLVPRAPDFGSGRFSLVTTVNGVPSAEDLARTIRRGMPGSAMPAFAWLSDKEVAMLVDHVVSLGKRRMAAAFEQDARKGGGVLASAAAKAMAEEAWQPGKALALPPPLDDDTAHLARGRELYMRHCAACHGDDGRGRGPIRAWRDALQAGLARDFTAGVLRGPGDLAGIAARVLGGMPRAGRPPTLLGVQSATAALVAYVRSLIPEGVAERLVQTRQVLRAKRVDALPTSGNDAEWAPASKQRIVLAPFEWSEDAIVEAELSALQDGKRRALRLVWDDASEDRSPIASDACALQFSNEAQPPLFGMGSREKPTNMWHWRAFRLADIAGELDALDVPHARRDPLTGKALSQDVPVYRTTPPLRESSRTADEVQAQGIGELEVSHGGTPLRVDAQWPEGKWRVLFSRALEGSAAGEVDFVADETKDQVQVGIAIWNGAERRSTTFKSITIWHGLVIE